MIPGDSLLFVGIGVLKALYLPGLTSKQSMKTIHQQTSLETKTRYSTRMPVPDQEPWREGGEVLWTDFVSTGRINGMTLSTSSLQSAPILSNPLS